MAPRKSKPKVTTKSAHEASLKQTRLAFGGVPVPPPPPPVPTSRSSRRSKTPSARPPLKKTVANRLPVKAVPAPQDYARLARKEEDGPSAHLLSPFMVSSGGSGRLAAPVPQPSEVIDVDYIPPSSQNYKSHQFPARAVSVPRPSPAPAARSAFGAFGATTIKQPVKEPSNPLYPLFNPPQPAPAAPLFGRTATNAWPAAPPAAFSSRGSALKPVPQPAQPVLPRPANTFTGIRCGGKDKLKGSKPAVDNIYRSSSEPKEGTFAFDVEVEDNFLDAVFGAPKWMPRELREPNETELEWVGPCKGLLTRKQSLEARRVNGARLESYYNKLLEKRLTEPVHQENISLREKILRHFDLDTTYGPSIGLSRLDRYRRAERLGIKPPVEVLSSIIYVEDVRGDTQWPGPQEVRHDTRRSHLEFIMG